MPSEREIREILSLLRSAGVSLSLSRQTPAEPVCVESDCLASFRLCPIEQAVIRVLLECRPERLTVYHLRDRIEAQTGEPIGEGGLRTYLARLTSPSVAILDNIRPCGYQITPGFLAELSDKQQCDIRQQDVQQGNPIPTADV
jgi:hypothetical protein